MKTPLHLLLAIALLLAATGCLEFVEQTMTYRHDAKADILYIFQDYRGIFGADKSAGLSNEKLEQFNSVLRTQRTFFFNNWITEFSREESLKSLAELRDPAKLAEKKMAIEAARSCETFLQLIVDNVRVENGSAYFDAKQRLCGVQKSHLKFANTYHPSAILRLISYKFC